MLAISISAVVGLVIVIAIYLGKQRSRYNYQRVLEKYFRSLVQTTVNMEKFSRLVPYILVKAMALSGAYFMVLDREKHAYIVRAGEGSAAKFIGREIPENSPLPSRAPELGAELVFPCVSESEYFTKPTIVAAINLGKKLSRKDFSAADIGFLETLSHQAALSIEYAFIFEELRNNQARVVRSEKLAALGITAAGIAHELRNPLTYIRTVAELLPKKWDDENFRASVAKMLPSEAQRMQLIIEGLLDYSRSRELSLSPLDIKDVIDKTLALLGHEIKKNNVHVKTNFDHRLKALADANRILQVFVNLVNNAIEAMGSEGGNIIISTSDRENSVNIEIMDTGPGIPNDKIKTIFDPFYTTKETGTGLGLMISRKIIDEHKGSISVQSNPGRGTIFSVSIPRAANGG